MRRAFVMIVSGGVMIGCQGVEGPFARRPAALQSRVDDPRLPISEQERRGRDRLALPEWNPRLLPGTYGELPGPSGK
jgi:hypothetical protein